MNSWPELLGYTSSFRAVRAPQRLTYENEDMRQKPKKPWKSTRMATRSHGGSSADRKSFSMELRPKSHNYHRTPKEIDYRRRNDSRSRSVSRDVPKTQSESRHARRGYSVPPASKRNYSGQRQNEPKTDSRPKKSYSRRGNDSRSRSVAREVPKPQTDPRHDRRGYSVPPSSKQKQKGGNDQNKRSGRPFKEATRNYPAQASRPQTSRTPSTRGDRSQYRKDANYEGQKTPTTSRWFGSSHSERKDAYSQRRYVGSRSEPTRRSERIANMRARESGKLDFHLKGPRDANHDSNKPKGKMNPPGRPRDSSPVGSRSKPRPKYVRKINWFPLVSYYQYPLSPEDDAPEFEGRDEHSSDDWANRRPRPSTPLPNRMFTDPEAEYFRANDGFPTITFEYPPSARPGRPTDYKGRQHDPQRPRPPSPTDSHYEPRAKYARKSDRPPQNDYPRGYLPKPGRSTEYRDSDLYNRPGCSSWGDQRPRGPSPVDSRHASQQDSFQENLKNLCQPPAIFDRVSTNSSESEKEDENNFRNPMNRKHFDEPSVSYNTDQANFFGRNRGPVGGGLWPNYHYPEAETSSPMRVNPSNIPPPWAFLHSGGFYPHNFNDDVWDEHYMIRPEQYPPSQHSIRGVFEDFHPYSSRQDSFQTVNVYPRPAPRDEANRGSTRAPSVDSISTIQVPESPEVPRDIVSIASIKVRESSEGPYMNTMALKQESPEGPDVNLKIVPKQEDSEESDVDVDNALGRAGGSSPVLIVSPSNSSRQDIERGSPEAGNFSQSIASIEDEENESSEMPDVVPSTTPQQDYPSTENTERSIMPFQGFHGDYPSTENTERNTIPFQGFYGESIVAAYVDQGMGTNQVYHRVTDTYSRMAENLSRILESLEDHDITPEVLRTLSSFLQEDDDRGIIMNLIIQNGYVGAIRQIRYPDGSSAMVRQDLSYKKSKSNGF